MSRQMNTSDHGPMVEWCHAPWPPWAGPWEKTRQDSVDRGIVDRMLKASGFFDKRKRDCPFCHHYIYNIYIIIYSVYIYICHHSQKVMIRSFCHLKNTSLPRSRPFASPLESHPISLALVDQGSIIHDRQGACCGSFVMWLWLGRKCKVERQRFRGWAWEDSDNSAARPSFDLFFALVSFWL